MRVNLYVIKKPFEISPKLGIARINIVEIWNIHVGNIRKYIDISYSSCIRLFRVLRKYEASEEFYKAYDGKWVLWKLSK